VVSIKKVWGWREDTKQQEAQRTILMLLGKIWGPDSPILTVLPPNILASFASCAPSSALRRIFQSTDRATI
jgi:hypothetical protein